MPDSKITALTSISTSTDPANDPLVIVDVSDTSMAATGTTKKVTLNQLLGASGTATLASATITGDLTVASGLLKTDSANTRVGVGTNAPSYTTHIRTLSPVLAIQDNTSAAAGVGGIINFLGYTSGTSGANVFGQVKGVKTSASVGGELQFFTSDSAGNSVQRYLIDSTGVSTWAIGGSTAMTLNATGLGVGRSPSYKLDVAGVGNFDQLRINAASATKIDLVNGTTGVTYSLFNANSVSNGFDGFGIFNGTSYDLRIVSGNVGIGVTPSAAWTSNGNLQVGIHAAIYTNSSLGATDLAYNSIRTGSDTYQYLFATSLAASRLQQRDGSFRFFTAPAGTSPNAITFTQAMTLDASGNLLVGKTAASVTTVGFQTLANGEASVAMAASTGASTTLNVWSTGAAAYRFYVGMNGTISATNTTISAISDARLKENVQDIDVGLGAILALKPRKFDWKSGKGKDIKGDRGFIAQEFEQVFPNLIDEWKDPAPEGEAPYKSVRQDLIPVLVKAIQELAARVQTLETR